MARNTAPPTGLATRYAAALFELARERDRLAEVERDLDAVAGALEGNPDLRRLTVSPVLSREEQGRGVATLADQLKLGEVARNLLGVLAANRRLFEAEGVIRAFRARLADSRGEVQAELVSAVELEPAELAEVEAGVRRFAGREVRLERSVDPSLLGGLTVRVGSRLIDASLRTKLQHLEQSMRGVA